MVSDAQKQETLELEPMRIHGMQDDGELLTEDAYIVENELQYEVLISDQRIEPVLRTYVCHIEMIYYIFVCYFIQTMVPIR